MKKTCFLIVSLLIICCIGWSFDAIAAKYNPVVEKAQKRLTELGYNPGPIDGKMGKKTTNAIRNFQRDSHLALTGALNEETIQKLGLNLQEKEADKEKTPGVTPSVDSLTGSIQIDGKPRTIVEKGKKIGEAAASGAKITIDISKDKTSIEKVTISLDAIKLNIKGATFQKQAQLSGIKIAYYGPFPITKGNFETTKGSMIKGRFTSPAEVQGTIHLFFDYSSEGKKLKIDLGKWDWNAKGQ